MRRLALSLVLVVSGFVAGLVVTGRMRMATDSRAAEAPPAPQPEPAPTNPPEATDLGDIARISLRLPEGLKEAAERAAAAEAISVNAWLVRAIARVLSQPSGPQPPGFPPPPPPGTPGPPSGRGRLGRRVTGFAQA